MVQWVEGETIFHLIFITDLFVTVKPVWRFSSAPRISKNVFFRVKISETITDLFAPITRADSCPY